MDMINKTKGNKGCQQCKERKPLQYGCEQKLVQPLGKTVKFPPENFHRATVDSKLSLLDMYLEGLKSACQRQLTHVHCSVIHDSQDTKAT